MIHSRPSTTSMYQDSLYQVSLRRTSELSARRQSWWGLPIVEMVELVIAKVANDT